MIENPDKNKSKILIIAVIAIWLAAVVMLVLKAPYGFGTTDECYYLTTPLRLVKGDGMLVDEWYSTQLFSFVVYPLLKLYMLIAGTTEGILLAFRYIFIAVKVLASVYIYRRLRRICNIIPAFAAALLFLIYSPYNILGFSYNAIGMIALSMAAVTLASLQKKDWFAACFSGFLFAITVLCCPYLLLAYIIYILAMIINYVIRKESLTLLKFMTWLKFSIGAALFAVLFVVFVISRSSVKSVMQTLPHVLSDPAHQSVSFLIGVKEFLKTLIIWDIKRLVLLAAILLICILCLCIKAIQNYRFAAFTIILILNVIYVILPGYPYNMPNHYILPVNIAGFAAFLLLKKRPWELFVSTWIMGILYSFASFLSSNQGIYVLSSATIVSALASVVFICNLAFELKEVKAPLAKGGSYVSGFASLAFIAAQLCVIAVFVCNMCFWDDNAGTLSIKIDRGCEKGLITSSRYADEYNQLWDETKELRELEEGRVMYMTVRRLWLILDDAKPVGSCFSYYDLMATDAFWAQEEKAYFEMFPDRKAEHYYFDSDVNVCLMADAFGLEQSKIVETDSGNYIYYGND